MGWHEQAGRARDRIARLALQALDLTTFWNEAAAALRPVVPCYLQPCWFTLDPATLLVTSHYDHGVIPELPPAWLAHEYGEDELHQLVDVARSARGISTLHELTDGEPSRSARWTRFVQPFGGEQELLAALRSGAGDTWGILALYREPGRPRFSAEEQNLVSALAPSLGEGAMRALLVGEAAEPEVPDAPGAVIVRADLTVDSSTPSSTRPPMAACPRR
jgi:GAF domain-containing protein